MFINFLQTFGKIPNYLQGQQLQEEASQKETETNQFKSKGHYITGPEREALLKVKTYFSAIFNVSGADYTHKWFVPKVTVLIFLCTNWQCSTSLMYIGTLVVTLAACPYLFQLDWLSQSCATVVCVWSCFLTSLRLRCRKISNVKLSNFV